MNYNKSRTMLLSGVGICLMVLLIAMVTDKTWILVVGVILLLATGMQFFRFYRCPYCSKSFGCIRGPIPKHCPHCGKELG
jgi:hypothetical protein